MQFKRPSGATTSANSEARCFRFCFTAEDAPLPSSQGWFIGTISDVGSCPAWATNAITGAATLATANRIS